MRGDPAVPMLATLLAVTIFPVLAAASEIGTAQQALALAARLTALDTATGQPASARQVTMTHDPTPFLGAANVGRRAWQVDYDEVELSLLPAPRATGKSSRIGFRVLLDAENGALLSVTSRRSEEAADLPGLSAHEATRQMTSELEEYTGYPATAPRVRFVAALDRLRKEGVGSPLAAREIHAVYVLHSRRGSPPRAVWAITLRGLPPLPARGPGADGVPAGQRNHIRNVVDAETGQVLFATNSPQPE